MQQSFLVRAKKIKFGKFSNFCPQIICFLSMKKSKKTLINLSRDSTKKEQGTKDTHFTLIKESQCNAVLTHYGASFISKYPIEQLKV
jgi:hypothetical protein